MKQQQAKPSPWESVKNDLSGMFDRDTFRAWFEGVDCVRESEGVITLGVPNDFAAIWIEDNYADLITSRLQQNTGQSVQLEFEVKSSPADSDRDARKRDGAVKPARVSVVAESPPRRDKTDNDTSSRLPAKREGRGRDQYLVNPKNNFDNYVVGAGRFSTLFDPGPDPAVIDRSPSWKYSSRTIIRS